ncbi:hypothetical protein [Maribacter ulvicola]|uniref:Right handed beta helix region n=1 Tax=Maribacter ulvicola TaxID=228959 RepID=A0A1N6U425_9FLAO|nr:hypothetical protein [Maribacter ulvicola]SIQ60287.1 hypothetical protein SAMN05421797_102189 [Maribacter ulvicola]
MALRILIILSALFALLWSTSCRKDFEYAESNGHFSFSRDTVYLDTVFSNIGSSTYSLKVYNNTKDDIIIPNIALRNGNESFYRLNVDGVAGKEFENTPIYAEDSLFIFIETTIDITDDSLNELLYTDAILFDKDPFQKSVELVTLAKDAIFLYPSDTRENKVETIILYNDEFGNPITVKGFELSDHHLNFKKEKSYVIYGYAIVPEDKELLIDPGTRVHFHQNSGIIVQDKATITINGQLSPNDSLFENEVIFEGDRLEPEFENISGQWGTIWISAGSINNSIDHLTIKNAELGLYVEGQTNEPEKTLTITNSRIFNSSRHNLWTRNAKIEASNIILGAAGKSSLLIENGGSYSFTHATIANYWNKGFRSNANVTISNSSNSNTENGFDLLQANFKNCIIDGNNSNEVSLQPNNQDLFNFNFQNCFIKYNENQSSTIEDGLYNFENGSHYLNVILSGNLDYFQPFLNDYRIGLESEVINKGDVNVGNSTSLDIIGTARSAEPDLGAFQAKEKDL